MATLLKKKVCVCMFVVLLSTVVNQASNIDKSTSGTTCPSNIIIKVKSYFTQYLKMNASGAFGLFPPLLTNISQECCGQQEVTIKFINETSNSHIQNLMYHSRYGSRKADNKANNDTTLTLYFPVFTAKEDTSVVYREFYFLEIIKSPGPAFIMLTEELKDAPDPSEVLIESWPLFLLLIIMAAVVGIIVWFLDHCKNNEQFPSNFYKGSWEGFWWAMVTMTTVGYGDKAPVSFAARILTVLWMITGTIVSSIFIANVTTVLTTTNVAALRNAMGQKVGVLNSKHFYQREINEGAIFMEYEDQESLTKAFYGKEITRLLVPNYLHHLYFMTKYKKQNDFVITNVIKHPFAIGLAVVNHVKNGGPMEEFLRCWERSIVYNSEVSMVDYSIIDASLYHMADNARSLLNQSSILFLIYGLIGLLVLIFVVGSLWEYWKHFQPDLQTMESAEIVMTSVPICKTSF